MFECGPDSQKQYNSWWRSDRVMRAKTWRATAPISMSEYLVSNLAGCKTHQNFKTELHEKYEVRFLNTLDHSTNQIVKYLQLKL
jgi:hypothetical protein